MTIERCPISNTLHYSFRFFIRQLLIWFFCIFYHHITTFSSSADSEDGFPNIASNNTSLFSSSLYSGFSTVYFFINLLYRFDKPFFNPIMRQVWPLKNTSKYQAILSTSFNSSSISGNGLSFSHLSINVPNVWLSAVVSPAFCLGCNLAVSSKFWKVASKFLVSSPRLVAFKISSCLKQILLNTSSCALVLHSCLAVQSSYYLFK